MGPGHLVHVDRVTRARPRERAHALVLVNMPWHDLDRPPLAQGLLTALVKRDRPQWACHQIGANLMLPDFLDARVTNFGTFEYAQVANNLVWDLIGEWLFSPSLFAGIEGDDSGVRQLCDRKGIDFRQLQDVRAALPEFCDAVTDTVMAIDPDVVGFTSTFMQNVASLAVAKRIKDRCHDTLVVFGGANCEGPMGEALVRNFGSSVDVAVAGEGEHVLLEMLDTVERRGGGAIERGVRAGAEPVVLPDMPRPDYTDYFDQVETLAGGDLDVSLVLEASRGCWWGERRHCTFCGLNGSSMRYRTKTFEQFTDDVLAMVQQHQVLSLTMNDNIMPQDWPERLAEWAGAIDADVSFFWEVKASLDWTQVARLAAAGCRSIQPGVESLSNDALRAMRKGVTAAQNVALMVAAKSFGIDVEWSILYGFPHEEMAWYRTYLDQSRRLHHLRPPMGAVRILLERFSPNFEDPSLGFRASARAHRAYRSIYPTLGDEELFDLAFMFDSTPQGLSSDDASVLCASVAAWRAAHHATQLSLVKIDGEWHVHEVRPEARLDRTVPLDGPTVALLERLRRPCGADALRRWGGPDVIMQLEALDELGWVFFDGRAWVSVVEFGNTMIDARAARELEAAAC
jgi:ribosomal peptide maturation radical SAM protein 1